MPGVARNIQNGVHEGCSHGGERTDKLSQKTLLNYFLYGDSTAVAPKVAGWEQSADLFRNARQ